MRWPTKGEHPGRPGEGEAWKKEPESGGRDAIQGPINQTPLPGGAGDFVEKG